MSKTIGLLSAEELPKQVDNVTENTLGVFITYKRVVAYGNTDQGKRIPIYGGAMASYPKENGFKLDKSSLYPSK